MKTTSSHKKFDAGALYFVGSIVYSLYSLSKYFKSISPLYFYSCLLSLCKIEEEIFIRWQIEWVGSKMSQDDQGCLQVDAQFIVSIRF